MKVQIDIMNMPRYAEAPGYIVANAIDGQLWFYGRYDSCKKAMDISEQMENSVVINNMNSQERD